MVDLAFDSHDEDLARRAADLVRGVADSERLTHLVRTEARGAVETVIIGRELGRGLASIDSLVALMAAPDVDPGSTIGLVASDARPGERVVVASAVPQFALLLDDRSVSIVAVAAEEALRPLDPDSVVLRCELLDPVHRDGRAAALRARLALVAAAAGVAQATAEASASYAVDRFQFGRPIGINQAIKHRCADMAIQAEASWSATSLAAVLLDAEDATAPRHVDASHVVACRAALANAASNIQNHGAEGTRGDRLPHRFLKRAHVLAAVGGGWRRAARGLGPV